MQMLLSFVQNPSNDGEPSPDVWATLQREQRSETLGVLARLLAKTAMQSVAPTSHVETEEQHDD
jgi:hypothetical protein